MSDKTKNPDSTSSDASKQPSQPGPSGSSEQNPQPQSNVQSTTTETDSSQAASDNNAILPIGKANDPPWDPVNMGRALIKNTDDPNDPAHLDISDDEGKAKPEKR
ncbi:hypothetical protein ACLX1H_003884 [Fusarium chlamydosporum]